MTSFNLPIIRDKSHRLFSILVQRVLIDLTVNLPAMLKTDNNNNVASKIFLSIVSAYSPKIQQYSFLIIHYVRQHGNMGR